jgi:DNA polymerase-3 subunit epsilon
MREAAQHFLRGGVVVDVETTGFANDPFVEIVEVAIVDHQGEVLLNTLVKPRRFIPWGATRVHGIYDEMVQEAPPFEEVYLRMLAHLQDAQVAAYNFSFERDIFKQVCRQYQMPAIQPAKWYCPMRAYQAFRGLPKFFKLTAACAAESIPIERAHRALGDCQMTLALIQKMAEGPTHE